MMFNWFKKHKTIVLSSEERSEIAQVMIGLEIDFNNTDIKKYFKNSWNLKYKEHLHSGFNTSWSLTGTENDISWFLLHL